MLRNGVLKGLCFLGHLPRFLSVTLEVDSFSSSCAKRGEDPGPCVWVRVGSSRDPPGPPDFPVSPHTPTLQTSSWLPLGWAVCGLLGLPHPLLTPLRLSKVGPAPLLACASSCGSHNTSGHLSGQGLCGWGQHLVGITKCH